ncbi:MAG: glycosyltransferase [Longimicrobiales bacterium]
MTSTPTPGLVTVIVASYNYAGFLQERLESLIAQSYESLEILVIDDRSTDKSFEVLRSYASHPKVNVVEREENGGWVTVSNQGVALAKGEFVLFANCDDSCEPEMIERLVSGMRATPTAGVSYCRSWLVNEDGRVIGDDFLTREAAFRARCAVDTPLTGQEMSRFLMESCVIPNLSAALIRRECFETAGLFSSDYRVCCDWDLYFRIFSRYDAYYVSEALNRFRQHPATIRSSTKDRVLYGEMLRLLLTKMGILDLRWRERWRARTQVMSLWALHLIGPSFSGLRDFPFHLRLVLRYDSLALLTLLPAVVGRMAQVLGKIIRGRVRAPRVAVS